MLPFENSSVSFSGETTFMRIPKNLPGESPRRIAVGIASAAVILSFVACSSSDDDSGGSGVVDSGDGVDVVDGDADGDGFLAVSYTHLTLPTKRIV